ncbi:CDGSH iron-sulfur domain-containing protein [Streptomyces sp. NPDC002018]|uniref:CDGSH iron-sulfur domain-containing protein n=1 Tax=Streptomyces sp. NPDC002018 TaxID=3364629 RepID=UPI0036B5F657
MPKSSERPRRVTVDRNGPVLVEGPVEVVMDDGSVVSSDRFVVAICACRRSRAYPWCDTSHRRRTNPPDDAAVGRDRAGREHPGHGGPGRPDGKGTAS